MTPEAPVTEAPMLGEPLPIELMNTIWADRDGVHDALRDRERCALWLESVAPLLKVTSAASPVAANPTSHDASSLRELRDALRRLAAIACDDDRERAVSAVADQQTAVDILNRACGAAPIWSHLSWPPTTVPALTMVSTGSAFQMAMSAISEAAATLFAGPQREDIRACRAPGCVLYFVRDRPRRRWCSDGCGNRARVARHYQSHRPNSAKATSYDEGRGSE